MALQRLVLVSSSEDITTLIQPAIFDTSEPRRVLEVAKCEATLNTKLAIDVLIDEEIAKRLVKRH